MRRTVRAIPGLVSRALVSPPSPRNVLVTRVAVWYVVRGTNLLVLYTYIFRRGPDKLSQLSQPANHRGTAASGQPAASDESILP